ncbi:Spore wall maturation protein DIT1 [Colletotrichum orbiculare MAFF 240422]|uniref:Spore wall maturation protein DIT1 n=1 Tax=Colletotrichum orbiculare (strain 104-T / ATCC 96160 / CBS 514.97 / LARS 414 / MAFF 240422) TaxID=1213857 RepID=N4V4T8_COLOR|nr:Spore wall maturation protein DIT1 [Colletotrichum orbiculare MAFF 240422]
MEFSNDGNSIFHRFQASFVHDGQGQLLYCSGPSKLAVQTHWSSIKERLPSQNAATPSQTYFDSADLDDTFQGSRLYEKRGTSSNNTSGIILDTSSQHNTLTPQFEHFFARLLLDQADFAIRDAQSVKLPRGEPLEATEDIVNLFDSFLRYQGKDDQWQACGRAYFTDRVRHFTSQHATIELCLPAFPCKSSNTNKVLGKAPDRGEQLALERLHSFVEAIEKVYQPGAKLWIISDGHVFSDCIGVDDADVDAYGEQLKDMNHAVGLARGNTGRVGFKSLVDLFELNATESQTELFGLANQLGIPDISHHVRTGLTVEAELCRQILMAGCQPQESAVRAKIKSQNPAILALYRGFSRFMLEDLELHPFTQAMTRTQQKKLSTRVAFEMIMRNQAYSNLVELLFPNYVRLSIHAHNNAGPKFGIQLFDPAVVRVVEGLSPDGVPMTSRDLLHIPTPWHNCVVEIEGSPSLLVTKASIPRKAVEMGAMTGGVSTAGGASFNLRPLKKETVANVGKPAPASTPATTAIPVPAFVKPHTFDRVLSFQPAKAPKTQSIFDWSRKLAAFPVICWLGVVFYHRFVGTLA